MLKAVNTRAATLGLTAIFISFTLLGRANAKPVLADLMLLEEAGITALATHAETGVGYADLSVAEEARLQQVAHWHNRCGGYEALPIAKVDGRNPLIGELFGELSSQDAKNRRYHPSTSAFTTVVANPAIESAIKEISVDNIRKTVEFLSSFPDREYRSSTPNVHVDAMKARLDAMIRGSAIPAQVDLITHRGISQKSLRVRLTGATRPNEIVVLGGHLDSINQEWGGSGLAPGADDNASGAADMIETLRILLTKKQPERTIEIFLYAGEEGGLLGSAEIAKDYKAAGKTVIAVLQLDMTLFPGVGEFVLGSMTDFTSAWLRGYVETINGLYIKAKIVEDKCGYGCSDHASWYRQGYPTVMPFEATFDGMNHNLHTERDVIDSKSSFEHAVMFAKIAVVMGMDLANSTEQEPK
jgi:leucyl aminopeptidase